jgi:eukaryotic-like serine/threonine-protein kinase
MVNHKKMNAPISNDNLQATIDYSPLGEASAAGANPPDVSRAKVGFIEGSRPLLSEETAALLRQRLKAVALVLSITLTMAFVSSFFILKTPFMILRGGIVVVLIGSYLLLRSSRPIPLRRLQLVELFVFGGVAVQAVLVLTNRTMRFAESQDVASTITGRNVTFLVWSVLILLYGMFMPNTWKRAALILLPAACIPFATNFFMRWKSSQAADIFDKDQFGMPVPWPFLAAFAAIYATHVIHSIRREAFKAKQFGQYRLKEKLGSGGMGEVYRAEHVLLKRPCAIKLIRPENETDATALARFEREVRATAELTHWNTVEIYDFGHTDDGTFYYVMELLPGLSLEDLVKKHGPLPPERVVHLLLQTCRALREAHSRGLIHRDIKPANIFAAVRGGVYDVAKLLDFGLVKQERSKEAEQADAAQAGSLAGSPLYMAPEQASEFGKADARTDIYALGAVSYYLLTGKPPFSGKSPMAIIIAHSHDEAAPPSKFREGIPDDLEVIVLRCLAKKPEERFPDAVSLEKALANCECAEKWDDQRAAVWWKTIEPEQAK